MFGDEYRLLREGVYTRMVHGRRDVEGGGYEVLHLIWPIPVTFEKDRKVDHRSDVASRVTCDEIRYEVLLFTCLL